VLDIATEEIHVANHFANWINDIRQIQITCRDLMEHRRKKKEVLAIYDNHVKPRVSKLFELQRCIQAAKPAAENENTSLVCHAD
jgi:hypothetical protein